MKTCTRCLKSLSLIEFSKTKTGHMSECKQCRNLYSRTRNRTLRSQVIESLGGKCQHCGFSDSRALQVDHINGDGATERKSGKGNPSHTIYRKILAKQTEQYQLLCANCNWIKRVENEEQNHHKEYQEDYDKREKSSSFKGVNKQGNSWRAMIMVDGKQHYIGSFHTESEAAEAYKNKCVELRGEEPLW